MLYDTEKARQYLIDTEVPPAVCKEYLSILTNLNALHSLLTPEDLADAVSLSQSHLEKITDSHQARKHALEEAYPDLELAGELNTLGDWTA
ncbi:hypothetical protein [Deinococcus radiophilus]|uniref:Uncharacterized protein n=1 Tax=Deinococcus radiophilus TaxID=32062 RepID=A0A3S0JRN8_9DEIO|nr:hypothetical protein [Deinococcus radiophilus]RTR27491.1 hypothetical protein EJ104_06410 [Deinococcus radiophilus]UFA50355.1 hypothetical protein LMT64_00045 [Deinococcus radiophilus]